MRKAKFGPSEIAVASQNPKRKIDSIEKAAQFSSVLSFQDLTYFTCYDVDD